MNKIVKFASLENDTRRIFPFVEILKLKEHELWKINFLKFFFDSRTLTRFYKNLPLKIIMYIIRYTIQITKHLDIYISSKII